MIYKNSPVIYSFFSGAGFLDLGFEKAGLNVVYVNELHVPFLLTYQHARKKMGISQPKYGYFQGDINELLDDTEERIRLTDSISSEKESGNIVGFIGGPPCPDFSVGGKNRGHEGDHGKLTASYFRLICNQHPDFFVFENVKGLWRTKKHRAFYEEMKELVSSNDYVLSEKLINSIEYGVPQDRERIILVGFKKHLLEGLKIPLALDGVYIKDFPWEINVKYPAPDVFQNSWPKTSPFLSEQDSTCPKGLPEELTVEYWFRLNDVQNHPNAKNHFTPRAGLAKFETIAEGDDSRKSYKRLHRWRYSPTACYGNNEVHLHPYYPRRISVAEALAIQSLPANYEIPQEISLTNMFKTVGNGVPFLAAKGIAQTVLDYLRKE